MEQEGKLRVGDRIIEINEQSLNGVTFVKAQEMFREAMRSQEIALRVIPAEPLHASASKAAGPPLLPKPNLASPPSGQNALEVGAGAVREEKRPPLSANANVRRTF